MISKLKALLNQSNTRSLLRSLLMLTVGITLVVISFHLFMRSTKLAPGGVQSLAFIINHYTELPIGVATLVARLPMLILGFFYLGGVRFLLSAAYLTVLYSIGVDAVEYYFPLDSLTDDLLLNTIYGGILGGLGLGLIFLGNGAVAGTSIISRVLQFKTGLPITVSVLFVDGVIILGQGSLFGWEVSLYSLLMVLVWGIATDFVMEGPSVVRTVFIITNRPVELAHALNQLGVGVTSWQSEGTYTQTHKTTLFCTVNRPDTGKVQDVVKATDPDAFMVIGQGMHASGGRLKPSAPPQPPLFRPRAKAVG